MEKQVKIIVEKAVKDAAFAAKILKDPRSALAGYELTPKEIDKVIGLVKRAVPPPA